MEHIKFAPLIKAVLNPQLERIEELDNLTTEEIVEYITMYMPDDIVLGIATERPGHKEQYGFVLNPRAFGVIESKERLAQIMTAFLKKFGEAQKNINDWKLYVGQVAKNGQ